MNYTLHVSCLNSLPFQIIIVNKIDKLFLNLNYYYNPFQYSICLSISL